ncbi:MAG TPA: NADP oxidoreductase [Microscillaceae bacterium]|nr:NADP oxidoreductase [Microscillaceae bacterium]
MKISFIGAGNVAKGLGNLFVQAGHEVLYSSRTPSNNQVSIEEALKQGTIVCFAVPYNALRDLLISHRALLKEKIVVDITNAINISDWSPVLLGQETSGGEEVARLLPESRVVKAFNTIFADTMTPEKQVFAQEKLTAFIASDDAAAAQVVKTLANEAGFAGVIVGELKNARYLEAMAHLNIAIALAGGGTQAGFKYFQS